MTFNAVIARIERANAAGEMAMGKQIKTFVTDRVPIDRGGLRRSGKVIREGGKTFVIYGAVGTKENAYARFQYGLGNPDLSGIASARGGSLKFAQYHHASGKTMRPLRDLHAGQGPVGKGARAAYNFSYRKARKASQLVFFPDGAQWFKAAKGSSEKAKLSSIYANAVARELRAT